MSRAWEDLEAQFEHARNQSVRAEARELARAERTTVMLEDRLDGALTLTITVNLRGGRVYEGAVSEVGRGWCVVSDPRAGHVLVPFTSLDWCELPASRSRRAQELRPRQPLARYLESLSARAARVSIVVGEREMHGCIAHVWGDHIEMRSENERRAMSHTVIPVSALTAVIDRSPASTP